MWLLNAALVRGQILDDPDTVWTDYCYPEPCNFEGICVNGTDGFQCDCYFDHTGDTCETELTACSGGDSPCDQSEHGKCLYDDSDEGYSCYCDYGWMQEEGAERMGGCTVRNSSQSLCDVYDCSGNGECQLGDPDPDDVSCICEMGWGGDYCQYRYKDVVNIQFLEMAAVLSEITSANEMPNMGYNCAYLWPLSLMEAPMAMPMGGSDSETSEISICRCLRMYKEAENTTYVGLQSMRLDPFYSYSVDELLTLHCRDVSYTDSDVAEFVAGLIEESTHCYDSLNEPDIPLYLRNQAECTCLNEVAEDEETAMDKLIMPLDITVPVASAYLNWEKCNGDIGICNFPEIYTTIREELANYPSVSKACGAPVLGLAKSKRGTPTIAYEEDFCPCMTEIAKYCPTCGIDWFSCYATSSDYRTLYDTFSESCTSVNKNYREWAWNTMSIALSYVDQTLPDMALCSAGMVTMLGRAGVPLGADDRTQVLLCDCYSSLVEMNSDDAEEFMTNLVDLGPSGIDLTAEICVSQYGASVVPTEETTTTDDSSSSSWDESKDIIILVILSVLFLLNLVWLCWTCRTTERSYFELGPTRVKGRIQSKFNARPMRAGPSVQTIKDANAQMYDTTQDRTQLP